MITGIPVLIYVTITFTNAQACLITICNCPRCTTMVLVLQLNITQVMCIKVQVRNWLVTCASCRDGIHQASPPESIDRDL